MKRSLLLTLLTLAVAVPSFGDERERHQSYLSYDDGGTVVRSGDDNREIEAHRNLPIYPGDEVVTARRGRAEVRLSDGNIIGIDRTTAIRFRSILDAYEGDSDETVAELRHGKVAVYRTDLGRDHVRLDTDNASYVAERESLYSVETDSRGRDRVVVFDGSIEVRTPTRATRLRQGESATIDGNGLYDLTGDQRDAADDFERWFLRRAERIGSYNNRYVDRRLGYWADDLDDHGRWVHVAGIGWTWRPYVNAGWRPYYNGYWHHSRWGALTWISYDPWGWGTYHYGRWAHDPSYGWVWVPGYGYSPAWVYWMYGSNYVGWAPAGWWDCYRPYYNWAYHPYRNVPGTHGFGFYGRVRINEVDLRPWTFVDSNGLVSNRIDRAALTTDAVKQRLALHRDGYTTIGGGGAGRFTREELRDPAGAIRRRGLDGQHTGRESGAPPTDLTTFIRRDGDVAGSIRDRVVTRRGGGGNVASGGGSTSGSPRTLGGLAPVGGGSTAPVGRGGLAPVTGGSTAPIGRGTESGRVNRGGGDRADTPTVPRAGSGDTNNTQGDRVTRWRDRVGDRGAQQPATTPSTTPSTEPPRTTRDSSWRGRVRNDVDDSRTTTPAPSTGDRGSSANTGSGSSDVPRRVIDRIGGARVVPRDDSAKRTPSADRSSRSGNSSNSGSSSRSGSSMRDSGGSSRSSGSGSGSSARSGGGGSSSSGGGSSRSSSGSSGSSGGNRGGGGEIKRDQ